MSEKEDLKQTLNTQSNDSFYPTQQEWDQYSSDQRLSSIHDCLLEMYLNLKLRNFNEKETTIDSEKVDKELDKLKNINSIQLIEYIKSSIEIIIRIKLEESENKSK